MSEQDTTPSTLDRIIAAVNDGEALDNEDARYLAALVIQLDRHLQTLDQVMGLVTGMVSQMPDHTGDAIWKGLNLRDLNQRKAVKAIVTSHVNLIMTVLRESLAPLFTEDDSAEGDDS